MQPFIDFLNQKSGYLLSNPYYDRADLLLSQIVSFLSNTHSKKRILTKDELKRVGGIINGMKTDLRIVKDKRSKRKKAIFQKIFDLKEKIDMFEGIEDVKLSEKKEPIFANTKIKEFEEELKRLKEQEDDYKPPTFDGARAKEIIKLKDLTDDTLGILIDMSEFLDKYKISLEILSINDIANIIRYYFTNIRFGKLSSSQEKSFEDIKNRSLIHHSKGIQNE